MGQPTRDHDETPDPAPLPCLANNFTLTATTIDEIATHHGRTLRLVLDAFNEDMPRRIAQNADDERRALVAAEDHRKHVEDVAAHLRFE